MGWIDDLVKRLILFAAEKLGVKVTFLSVLL